MTESFTNNELEGIWKKPEKCPILDTIPMHAWR